MSNTIAEPTAVELADPRQLDERVARIAWSTIIEPGDSDAGKLIDSVGSAGIALWQALNGNVAELVEQHGEGIATAVERWRARAVSNVVPVTIRQIGRHGIKVVIPGDAEWPTERLARLGDAAPLVLYVRGDAALLNSETAVAFVGARAATGYGLHATTELVAGLVNRGATIVSGAAYGIDGTAHRAALATGGKTIAVLAGGVDRPYPVGHETLVDGIAERGAVVSELPPGTSPTKWRFTQRNRIIAALSQAVVVTEAGFRSGSLGTASYAIDMGIPVGAVPGPITSAASAGCHRLIREYGATCVTGSEEIAELIA